MKLRKFKEVDELSSKIIKILKPRDFHNNLQLFFSLNGLLRIWVILRIRLKMPTLEVYKGYFRKFGEFLFKFHENLKVRVAATYFLLC